MKTRGIVCAVILWSAATAHAQFLGDAMAAAGMAETEQDIGMIGMSAINVPQSQWLRESASSPNAPRPSQNVSEPQWAPGSSPHPNPPSGTGQPQQPQMQSIPPTSTEPMPAMSHQGEYGIAGTGKTYSAADAAAWKAEYRSVGTKVSALPAGAEPVNAGGNTYAYNKGVFYQQQGNQWVVVPAPAGAKVKDRPAGGTLIASNRGSCLYYNGAFYTWTGEAAEVIKAPAGAIVTSIPDTAVKQDRNGQPCYVYGDTCFRPSFRGTTMVYVIAG